MLRVQRRNFFFSSRCFFLSFAFQLKAKFFCKCWANKKVQSKCSYLFSSQWLHVTSSRISVFVSTLFGISLQLSLLLLLFPVLNFTAPRMLYVSFWLFIYCSVAVPHFPEWNAMRTVDSHSHMDSKKLTKRRTRATEREGDNVKNDRNKCMYVINETKRFVYLYFCLNWIVYVMRFWFSTLSRAHCLDCLFGRFSFSYTRFSSLAYSWPFLQRSQSAISRWNVSFQMLDCRTFTSISFRWFVSKTQTKEKPALTDKRKCVKILCELILDHKTDCGGYHLAIQRQRKKNVFWHAHNDKIARKRVKMYRFSAHYF